MLILNFCEWFAAFNTLLAVFERITVTLLNVTPVAEYWNNSLIILTISFWIFEWSGRRCTVGLMCVLLGCYFYLNTLYVHIGYTV